MASNLYTHENKNIFKTWFLMAIFFMVVMVLGYFFSYVYSSPGILYFAVFFAVIMNIISYWNSDKIVLAIHKAKPVTRESHFDLWNITENLSIAAGLPMPRLFIVDDSAPNAFATGRNKEHGVVCVTTGLLQILDRNELEGVIAHELAHIGNRDILLSTVVVILVGFITLLSDFFLRTMMFGGRRDNSRGGGALMLIGIGLAILSPIVGLLIQLAISRRREFLADASGALLTRYPDGLASALKKISQANIPLKTANNADAHLFIANPFGSGIKGTSFKKLFMTHPPVEDRIRALTEK